MVDTAIMIAGKRSLDDICQHLTKSRSKAGLGNRHVGTDPGPNHQPDEGAFRMTSQTTSDLTTPALLRRHYFLLFFCLRRKARHSLLLPPHIHHPHLQTRHLRSDRHLLGLLSRSRLSERVRLHSSFVLLDAI